MSGTRAMDMTKPAAKRGWGRRLLPLAAIAAVVVAFFAFGLNQYVTLDALRDNRAALNGLVAQNGVLAALAYMAVYAAVVACSLPGGAILTLTGGFLFGKWLGTILVVVAATAGAAALFVVARTAFGDVLRARAGPFVRKMEAGFKENALSYLLVLRLVPAFPFWVVNLVPALLGVKLSTFVIATLVGIVPGTFVFASFGAGLGEIFDAGREVSLKGVLTPGIVLGLVGLAVLSLVPIVLKRLRRRR